MLNLNFSRRDFLRVGGLCAGGLTLADLRRLKARGAVDPRRSHQAIIFVYLFGGPSHVDSYDMKPDAPAEYRGEFRPMRSNVPGFDICELMPLQATIADKLALVRNLTFNPNFHDPVELFCGFRKPTEAGVSIRPDFGSVVSRLRQGERHFLPSYVALDETVGQRYRNGPAYLGLAHKPFIVRDNLDNFSLNRNVRPERLQERTGLLRQFDAMSRDLETAQGDLASMDHFTAQALDMVTSPRVRDAFDISREPTRLRDRYGTGSAVKLLQARRLVEAGVPVVTLTFGEEERDCVVGMTARSWDTHNGNFHCLRTMLPRLDRAVHALVTDLCERGLDQDVLVYVGGEMGRTPRVGQGTGNGAGPDGRDHWPRAGFGLCAGGGLRMGQVVGRTDRYGGAAVGVPYTPQNMLATLYRTLGIDPATTLPDDAGRPTFLLDNQRPITELIFQG
ncbi:MAG: DUF1501 domain-containing protein [Planctomycetes bacterium]|nr:DUF1501 domain-containing protein [Planctomycetota bacterium]